MEYKSETFTCDCGTLSHTFRFMKIDDEMWLEVLLPHEKSFFERLKIVIKYLFNRDSIYEAEIILQLGDIERLSKFLKE